MCSVFYVSRHMKKGNPNVRWRKKVGHNENFSAHSDQLSTRKKYFLAGMRSIWALEKTAQHQLQAKLQYGEVESDGVNFSEGKVHETIEVHVDGPY